MRWLIATALLTAVTLSFADAGERAEGLVVPPADSGKPPVVPPAAQIPAANGPADCLPPLPCGTKLLGTVRRNGAVELQIPALRW